MNKKILQRIIFIIILVAGGILVVGDFKPVITLIGLGLLVVVIIVEFIYMITTIIGFSRQSEQELQEGEIPEIDEHRWHYGESNNHIERQKRFIYCFYNYSDWMKTVIEDLDVAKLQKRKNYLKSRNRSWDKMVNSLESVILSLTASACCDFVGGESEHFPVLSVIVGVTGVIMLIVIYKSLKANDVTTLQDSVDEYEIGLIDSKIKEIHDKIETSCGDKSDMEIEKYIINFQTLLIRHIWDCRRSLKKAGIDAESVMHDIDDLKLCVGNYRNCLYRYVEIDTIGGFMLYDSNKTLIESYELLSDILNRLQSVMVITYNENLQDFNSVGKAEIWATDKSRRQ